MCSFLILGVKKNFCYFSSLITFFFTTFMNDNQILVVHSRGVYNLMGLISSITLFHCSVIMHSFQQQQKKSDFATFHQLCTF